MNVQNIKPASAWISELGLTLMKDLCVGYFKEVHNSKVTVAESSEKEEKSAISSIYFLQDSKEHGVFHRLLGSDESLFYHAGSPLEVFWLEEDSPDQLERRVLGPEAEEGQQLQVTVPAGKFFACSVLREESYCLMSIVVAPGFDPRRDEEGKRGDLLERFPKQRRLIEEFTSP